MIGPDGKNTTNPQAVTATEMNLIWQEGQRRLDRLMLFHWKNTPKPQGVQLKRTPKMTSPKSPAVTWTCCEGPGINELIPFYFTKDKKHLWFTRERILYLLGQR